MNAVGVTWRKAGRRALRVRAFGQAAVRAASRRGHGLVLLYHRTVPDGEPAPGAVAPTVGRRLLRRQVEALAELGDIVDLSELLEPAGPLRRVRFSLTFDDDYRSHVDVALPELRALGVPATFFLSGRALHGLGLYWWEALERLIEREGLPSAARALGADAPTPEELAAACERSSALRDRLGSLAPDDGPAPLDRSGIAELARAGMTVGFHTVHHPILPSLADDELAAALTDGRGDLEAVAAQPVTLLAYPHGKADRRVALAARTAGYRAAWTGRPRPARPGDDPFLLGRWEPGPLDADDFAAAVAVRLHRTAPRAAA